MAMTAEQIIEEARHWPHERVVELVDRLSLTLQSDANAGVEQAWKSTTRRRLAELENGTLQPIPGDVVSARIRKIVGR